LYLAHPCHGQPFFFVIGEILVKLHIYKKEKAKITREILLKLIFLFKKRKIK
jgi:hypothetical protein